MSRGVEFLSSENISFSGTQETGRGSVRFRDRLIYGLLAFGTTILAGGIAQVLLPSYKGVIAQIALPLATGVGIAAGAGFFGRLRRS